MSKVDVRQGDISASVEVKEGTTLLDALGRINGVHIDASCGGKGTCGKCKIKIIRGKSSSLLPEEEKFLNARDIREGMRLACMTNPAGDIVIELNSLDEDSRIITDHGVFTASPDPVVQKIYIDVPSPSLEDQRSNLSRVLDVLPVEDPEVSLSLRRKISAVLKAGNYSVTAVFTSKKLIGLEPGDTRDLNYSIAVDIGTTTIAAYLLDADRGVVTDTVSALNSQKVFGADVISRIEYSMKGTDKLEMLQSRIVSQVRDLCISLSEKNNVALENIYSVFLAGNTTMLHLFYGIDPEGIAVAPFIPGFLDMMSISSSELKGFSFNTEIFSLPSISGYVGADIVSGIVASGMDEREEISLLIDIGTNGEIVLGNRKKLYCCSTAAGPAFEGAHIKCGLGGITGAVDSAEIFDGTFRYTTIGSEKPIGICGSGIIDLTAVFLKEGFIDFTGRILEADEVDDKEKTDLFSNIRTDKGDPAFIVEKSAGSGTGSDIVFTQGDIREVQLAKAAISAGILTLLNKSGIEMNQISHVFIAGGFGSYISKRGAADIGLIPLELLEKTETLGNTSGQGAVICSLLKENLKRTKSVASITEYVELSSDPFFNMKYMEEMVFPEY